MEHTLLIKVQYVLIGTERQGSINFSCAAPSGEYKKIFFPFSHPELKADTSAAVSLHYFLGKKINASPVSSCTLVRMVWPACSATRVGPPSRSKVRHKLIIS